MKIYEIGPGGRIPIPPKGHGGVELVIWDLSQALRDMGHEVEIINRPDIENVEFDPDGVIHCHWAGHALKLQRLGLPYAYTSHSHIWPQTCARAIMGCDMYLALHEGMVPEMYRGPVEPVGNGVDLAFWHPTGEHRRDVVVSCAHYHKRKRLEMMHELIDKLPDNWTGIIVGPAVPGHVPSHPRIELMPERPIEHIRKIFSYCKVGFHPAKEEAYALVPMQMAACKLMTFCHEDCYVYGTQMPIMNFRTVDSVAGAILNLYYMGFRNRQINGVGIQSMSWRHPALRVERGLTRMREGL